MNEYINLWPIYIIILISCWSWIRRRSYINNLLEVNFLDQIGYIISNNWNQIEASYSISQQLRNFIKKDLGKVGFEPT